MFWEEDKLSWEKPSFFTAFCEWMFLNNCGAEVEPRVDIVGFGDTRDLGFQTLREINFTGS